jgi:hypothetical protein
MPKRRRKVSSHAAVRAMQRYRDIHFQDIRDRVAEGRFKFLCRQTTSRSVCSAICGDDDTEVFFVLNKRNLEIVTVLSPEQAAEWLV